MSNREKDKKYDVQKYTNKKLQKQGLEGTKSA